MKPFIESDIESENEIKFMRLKLEATLADAAKKLEEGFDLESVSLYKKAKLLTYYAGHGLKARIINEESDLEKWHEIDGIINKITTRKLNHTT